MIREVRYSESGGKASLVDALTLGPPFALDDPLALELAAIVMP
jgi:hypothetical protein